MDTRHLIKKIAQDDPRLPMLLAGLGWGLCFIIFAHFLYSVWIVHQRSRAVHDTAVVSVHRGVALSQFHLMGVYEEQATLQETPLPLVLYGTLVSTIAPRYSSALIAVSDGSTKRYRVGDILMEDVILQDIQDNYVIIQAHGERQRLAIRWPTLQDASANTQLETSDAVE